MNLCKDCRFYVEKKDEVSDTCTHEKAEIGGVREVNYHSCSAMRAGICSKGGLFEDRTAHMEKAK